MYLSKVLLPENYTSTNDYTRKGTTNGGRVSLTIYSIDTHFDVSTTYSI